MGKKSQASSSLTPKQQRALDRHMKGKFYDRNGTGAPLEVIKRVFIESDKRGDPRLILLCNVNGGAPDRRGRFEYVVFTDILAGRRHVPSDSYGYGTINQAIYSLKEAVFHSLCGVYPWVVAKTVKETNILMEKAR